MDNITGPPATNVQFPTRYAGFEDQYINGSWRRGHGTRMLGDSDPYTGQTLAQIALADRSDLDDAYQSAAKAQVFWANKLPAERTAVLLNAAQIMQARRPETLDWLIRESGSTRIKAEWKWQLLHGVTLEAASQRQ